MVFDIRATVQTGTPPGNDQFASRLKAARSAVSVKPAVEGRWIPEQDSHPSSPLTVIRASEKLGAMTTGTLHLTIARMRRLPNWQVASCPCGALRGIPVR